MIKMASRCHGQRLPVFKVSSFPKTFCQISLLIFNFNLPFPRRKIQVISLISCEVCQIVHCYRYFEYCRSLVTTFTEVALTCSALWARWITPGSSKRSPLSIITQLLHHKHSLRVPVHKVTWLATLSGSTELSGSSD